MKDILLIDGGLETEISRHTGVNGINDDPLWCTRYLKVNRDACVRVHRDYIAAGADIIKTNSYQASVEGFQKHLNLTESESIDLIKDAVQIAKDAIKLELGENENARKVLVAAIVGAYGASLHDGSEYRGEYVDTTPMEKIRDFHKPILDALVSAGADLIFFFTVPAITEAEVLLTLLKQHPHMKAVMSFSCKDDQHISHGEKLADAAEYCYKINAPQLAAIGVNCLHPHWVTPLLKSVRERLPQVGLMTLCNSGETFDLQLRKWVGKDKCVPLTTYMKSWIDLGATYIGGCCRTLPEDIKAFRQYIDNLENSA